MTDTDSFLRDARTCLQDGRLDEAGERCDAVIAASPDNLDAIALLGEIRLKEGRTHDALALFEAALQIDPQSPALHNDAGEALLALGRSGEAAAFFRRAVELDPAHTAAYRNLGAAASDLDRPQEALQHFAAAAQLEPQNARNWTSLGEATRRIGQIEEAIGCFRRALSLDRRDVAALHGMGLSLREKGMVDDAIEHLRKAATIRPDDAEMHQDMQLTLNLSDGLEEAEIIAAHREWGARLGQLAGPPVDAATDRNPQRSLRIGYLAPDFDSSRWAPLVLPLIAAHNRADFEVNCYATRLDGKADPPRPPRGARKLRGLAGLSDREAARRIADDRIDILVDFCGHLADSRLAMLALRPAALILGWARYPVTTGLAAVNFRLTDRVIDPQAIAGAARDSDIRLPGGAFCWAHQGDTAPVPGPLPAEANGYTTFGCHTALCHASPQTIANWAAILRRLPDARLRFAADGAQDGRAQARVAEAFDLHGIEADRLEIRGGVTPAEEADFWRGVDIGLDTQPWNGLLETCAALWMGVPVLTVRGETAAGRIGASLLIHAGLQELVAETRGRLVETAVNLARDPNRLADFRSTLREKVRTSPLGNGSRLAGELEGVYRRLWRRWSRADLDEGAPDGPARPAPAMGAASPGIAAIGASMARNGNGVRERRADKAPRLLLGGSAPHAGWILVEVRAGGGRDTASGETGGPTETDAAPGDVETVADWNDLSRYPDMSVAEIYAPSVLGRLAQGAPVRAFLKEVHRVLRPGGRLRVTVPDLESIGALFLGKSETADANLEAVKLLFGGGEDSGEAPRWGMTWDIARRILAEVGFRRITRSAVFADFPEESSRRVDGKPVTLNIEAVKTVADRAALARMA